MKKAMGVFWGEAFGIQTSACIIQTELTMFQGRPCSAAILAATAGWKPALLAAALLYFMRLY